MQCRSGSPHNSLPSSSKYTLGYGLKWGYHGNNNLWVAQFLVSRHNVLRDQSASLVTSHLISVFLQLHPGARLQWKRCADVPVWMYRAQVVVMEEKVYVGGGDTSSHHDDLRVFLYNKTGDKWSDLPRCTVRQFCLAQYKNRLITVGGADQHSSPTGKVLTLSADCQRWEELIPPMTTARRSLSVITTATAIIAAGGTSSCGWFGDPIAIVEVYSDNGHQWYTAEPLPAPHANMSSVVIDDFCYLMTDSDCYRASLSSLIQRATSSKPPSAISRESLWKSLPPTPLNNCSAVCLNGSLMAVGGESRDDASLTVHVFLSDKWVRLTNADLPAAQARLRCGAAQLSSDKVIIVGGLYRKPIGRRLKDVYIGTLLKD